MKKGWSGKLRIATLYTEPHGETECMWLGNMSLQNNVVPCAFYNSRLQRSNSYATVNNDPNHWLFDEVLDWGTNNNNGNLQNRYEYVGNNVPSDQLTNYSDTFTYDAVNRLSSATDSNGPCGGTCWQREFGYDQYGNMWVSAFSGVPAAGNTPVSNIYNAANNQMNGQSYDAAGNELSVNGNAASYDAENRISSITQAPAFGGGTETYQYDGNGQRVQKVAADGSITVYVYDALQQLAAEYSTASSSSPCQTCYLTYDRLGDVRLATDQNANLIARHDYLPFGEEVVGYADRSS